MAAPSLPYPEPATLAQYNADEEALWGDKSKDVTDTTWSRWVGISKTAHLPMSTFLDKPAPTVSLANSAQQGASAAGGAALNALGLGGLTNGQTWVRIGEGLVGLIVIAVGLSALTKNTSGGKGLLRTRRVVKRYVALSALLLCQR